MNTKGLTLFYDCYKSKSTANSNCTPLSNSADKRTAGVHYESRNLIKDNTHILFTIECIIFLRETVEIHSKHF